MEDLKDASSRSRDKIKIENHGKDDEEQELEKMNGGILLEGATEGDFASLLHLRGAMMLVDDDQTVDGVVYCPSDLFSKNEPDRQQENTRLATPFLWYKSIMEQTLRAEPILHCHG
ncbi:MAG: hypothetical protein SGARI_007382, partial [Bacillariaceae sp.]